MSGLVSRRPFPRARPVSGPSRRLSDETVDATRSGADPSTVASLTSTAAPCRARSAVVGGGRGRLFIRTLTRRHRFLVPLVVGHQRDDVGASVPRARPVSGPSCRSPVRRSDATRSGADPSTVASLTSTGGTTSSAVRVIVGGRHGRLFIRTLTRRHRFLVPVLVGHRRRRRRRPFPRAQRSNEAGPVRHSPMTGWTRRGPAPTPRPPIRPAPRSAASKAFRSSAPVPHGENLARANRSFCSADHSATLSIVRSSAISVPLRSARRCRNRRIGSDAVVEHGVMRVAVRRGRPPRRIAFGPSNRAQAQRSASQSSGARTSRFTQQCNRCNHVYQRSKLRGATSSLTPGMSCRSGSRRWKRNRAISRSARIVTAKTVRRRIIRSSEIDQLRR